jgi:hypothetical protein
LVLNMAFCICDDQLTQNESIVPAWSKFQGNMKIITMTCFKVQH